jgi:flavorubredoxin
MQAVVIYESLTGHTRHAAELMPAALAAHGLTVTAVCPANDVDLRALQQASLVIIGSWTQGHFVVGMKPAGIAKLRALPAISGKTAVVFCTYALNPGTVLDKLTSTVEDLGATVVGGMAFNRRHIASGVTEFAQRVSDALART